MTIIISTGCWLFLFTGFISVCLSCDFHLKENGIDSDTCLANTTTSACKTLQYVLENYKFENTTATKCYIHVFNNQTIDSENGIDVHLPGGITLNITGENNSFPVSVMQNSSFGITLESDPESEPSMVFWSNLAYTGSSSSLLKFEKFSSVHISNTEFINAKLVLVDVSQIMISDDCSFVGENVGLNIQNALQVEIFDTDFTKSVEATFTNVLNLTIDSCSFVNASNSSIHCANEFPPDARYTVWQISNSTFSTHQNYHNELPLISLKGNVTDIIISNNTITNNSASGLLSLSVSESTASFQFVFNNISNNNFSSFGLRVKLKESGECGESLMFNENIFNTNLQLGNTTAMIACCESHNTYIGNKFLNNKIPGLTISEGGSSYHNLSSCSFESNIALNVLADFGHGQQCRTGTMTVYANEENMIALYIQNALQLEIFDTDFTNFAEATFTNVLNLTIDSCSFVNALYIQNALEVEIFDTNFTNFVEATFTNVLNLTIDSCSFVNASNSSIHCANEFPPDAWYSVWQISNSTFSTHQNYHNELPLISLKGAVTDIIISSNNITNNIASGLLSLSVSESTASFQFIFNNISNNNFSRFGLRVKLKESGECGQSLKLMFNENIFITNLGNYDTTAMIEIQQAFCESHNTYINNKFMNNTIPSLTISEGGNSSHNLSSCFFESNMALNVLVDFGHEQQCRTGNMTVCANGKNMIALYIQNANQVEIFDTNFTNFAEATFANVSNLTIDSCSFVYASNSSINCANEKDAFPDAQYTVWQISNSTFSTHQNHHNELPLISLKGNVTDIIISDNDFTNNIAGGLLSLSVSESTASFQFISNNISNNNFSKFGLRVKLKENGKCGESLELMFIENIFNTNLQLGLMNTTAMIEIQQACCESNNTYIGNMFLNNTIPSLTISEGGSSFHDLSSCFFESNIALNVLVDFGHGQQCRTGNMTVYANALEFNDNSFYVTVDEDVEDPTVMRIWSPLDQSTTTTTVMAGNLTFYKNQGTAFTLLKVDIYLQGQLNFTENTGSFGGAMLLDETRLLADEEIVDLIFTNNTAKFGGAIYILSDPCEIIPIENCTNIETIFQGNNAVIEGPSIYSEVMHCNENCDCLINENTSIVSAPHTMKISASEKENSTKLSVFPGKRVFLNFTITDCNDTSVTCTAKPLALCKDTEGKQLPYSCAGHKNGGFKFEIDGPVYVHLESGWIDTQLALSIDTTGISSGLSPQLYFQCRNHRGYESTSKTEFLDVEIERNCPFGFKYNHTTLQCDCMNVTSQQYYCDLKTGEVCFKKGNWFGTVPNKTDIIVTTCNSINCNYEHTKPCSQSGNYLRDYVQVDLNDIKHHDERCVRGHSGLLCSKCNDGKTNSFDAYQCINNQECENWHKYVLLILSLIWPTVLGFFLLFLVPKIEYGVGNFYCPFFVLSVMGTIINGTSFNPYSELQILVNIYISTFLIGSRTLGFIPWCFFDMGGPMWITFYNYLGPLIIFLFLIVIVKSSEICFQKLSKIQSNPVKSISIALVVTFWSLAYTSITLITPVELLKTSRLNIEPDQKYFEDWHILVFAVSVTVIVCLTSVSILLIFFSICLGRLNKIKPFVDEFQHCYKAQYRWFAGVYFSSWIVLSVFYICGLHVAFNSLIYAILVLHCMCQPYRNQWMNRVDTILLIDLTLITSLDQTTESNFRLTVKYFAVIVPLLYITIGSVYILIKRCLVSLRYCTCKFIINQSESLEDLTRDKMDISVKVINYQGITSSTSTTSTTVSIEATEFQAKPSPEDFERESLLFSVENDKYSDSL